MTTVAVMITTKNRMEELKRTLEKVDQLSPRPDQVLVTVDGSDDGSDGIVRSTFPHVQLFIHRRSLGSVASRAEMMNATRCDLVLALDDDSYPIEIDFIARLTQLFNRNPVLAVATFPQQSDEYPQSLEADDMGEEIDVKSFPNSGACIRVSVYRQLPGFERMFFHMYEEPDFALQCVAAGWQVKYVPIGVIRHHWTANQRNELRNHHLHSRNEAWSTLIRCPFPYCILVIGYRVLSQSRFAYSYGGLAWLKKEPRWWNDAIRGAIPALRRRAPVSWADFRRWQRMSTVNVAQPSTRPFFEES